MKTLEKVIPSTASRVFTDLLSNSPKRFKIRLGFLPGKEEIENMFYFSNEQLKMEKLTHIKLSNVYGKLIILYEQLDRWCGILKRFSQLNDLFWQLNGFSALENMIAIYI